MSSDSDPSAQLARRERHLALFLRIAAVVLLSAAFAAVMPFPWMAATHAWLGLGTLPDTPIVHYLTRSLSAMYAFHGLVLWGLARDVRSHAPLIRLVGWGEVVVGLALFGIDLEAAMPTYWTFSEGPMVAAGGVVMLWLLARCSPAPAAASA